MSDDKNNLEQAVEQALDAFVYAPIGLIFDGPALFPKLVEKGRNQVNVARMMGQMAVQMGQSEAEKRVKEAQGQVRDTLVGLGVVPAPKAETKAEAPTPPTVTEESPDAPAPEQPAKKATKKRAAANKTTARKTTAKKSTRKRAAKRTAKTTAKAPAVDSLGIPGYDSLSASQVVSRLRGLSTADLDAVKAYESATRGRKTILTKIAQLQKG